MIHMFIESSQYEADIESEWEFYKVLMFLV